MSEHANKTADPGEDGWDSARRMASKVRAWIDEARFERSLTGPGAHRQAYRRLVDRSDEEVRVARSAPPPAPRAEHAGATGEAEPEPRHPEHAAPAPAAPEPRARRDPGRRPLSVRRQASRSGRGGTLFAISAFAAAFVAAPLGYFAFDLVDDELSVATEQVLRQAKAIEPLAVPPSPDFAAAKSAVQVLAAAASRRESLTVTDVVKAEAEAPFASLAEAVSFQSQSAEPRSPEPVLKPEPQQAESPPKPEPQSAERADKSEPQRAEPAAKTQRSDPRAAALLEQGVQLVQRGEIAAARVFFERAAELGEASALLQLARTYDPVALQEMKTIGIKPEPDKSIALYDKAREIGSGEAARGLTGLSAWLAR